MDRQVNWRHVECESRLDALADDVPSFVRSVLATIDSAAAQASPEKWTAVCQFFAGCARAASQQGSLRGGCAKEVADYIRENFPKPPGGCGEGEAGWNAGFFEFMDWLSSPSTFRPTRLQSLLDRA